jgi:hypothetical protein
LFKELSCNQIGQHYGGFFKTLVKRTVDHYHLQLSLFYEDEPSMHLGVDEMLNVYLWKNQHAGMLKSLI